VTPTAKSLKLTILTKTATEITGTFEGAFYKQNVTTAEVGTEYVLITEGSFKVPVK
jgi:hypothetical protein